MKESFIAFPFLSGVDFLLAECLYHPILIPIVARCIGHKDVHHCPSSARKYMITMCVFGVVGNSMHFSSVSMLPVGKVTLISNTRPIFVALLCFLFLAERLNLADVFLIIASFTGVALVTLQTEDS